MNDVKNPFLLPNKAVAVGGYILLNFIFGSVILMLLGVIYNQTHHLGLGLNDITKIIAQTDMEQLQKEYMDLYIFSNALGNLLLYLCMFGVVVFFMRNYVVEDAKDLVKGYKKLAWLIPACAIVGYAITYLVDLGIAMLVKQTSANQSSIEVLIQNGGAVYMFFAVVIFAPIVEELIYRKAIFEFLKTKHIAWSYAVSIVFFTFPHMITTFLDTSHTFLDNILMSIPYMFSGFALCLTYHHCNKNVYASWFFHLINNLIAFIFIFM
ncbi:MAG: CPBP family intramembrane metalloprotease [Anaeroplasmataceae bacterium]|nr:CPBP family intramembrane metalloprotease [Anaeroplasmataceae bacterium]